MAVILGIDAAWTPTGSSGIALLDTNRQPGNVIAFAASYRSFVERDRSEPYCWKHNDGGEPDVRALLDTAERIAQAPIDAIAIDMPMSLEKIVRRRDADNAVSSAFGAARAGVHSPSADRPGCLGARITRACVAADYTLATQPIISPGKWLLEVFPLAALVQLLRAKERPKYKVQKISKHWRHLPREDRLPAVLSVWTTIVNALQTEVGPFPFEIPHASETLSAARLKPREDVLDAIVCAWVGARVLEGSASPLTFADTAAAIWIPNGRP